MSGENWIEEQAAEYADLVGSFVESVVDSDTEEMIEYQLIWEGGDLGVALTTLEGTEHGVGVSVSRVTGKGFPFGIKNVGPGDILLSINLKDTTKMTLDQVVGFLQECDLPATLRFKKMSPETDNLPVVLPRKSTYVITSANPTGPTSPSDSGPPRFSGRSSQKALQQQQQVAQQQDPLQQQTQKEQQRYSTASSRPSVQSGRGSSSIGFGFGESRQSQGPLDEAAAVNNKSVPHYESESTMATSTSADPDSVPMHELPAEEPLPPAAYDQPSPPPAPVVHKQQEQKQDHRQSTPAKATEQPYDGIVLLANDVNDLGMDDDEESDDEYDHRGTWKGGEERITFDEETKTRESNEAIVDKDLDVLPESRDKSHSTVPMLGHYSIQTDAIPLIPVVTGADEGIGFIDNITTEEELKSPAERDSRSEPRSPVNNTAYGSIRDTQTGSPVRPSNDLPRESIRMTMDGGAEPMMKSQPIGTLYELCAKGNLRGVVQHLRVEGPDALIQREPNHGQTGLHLAVKSGNAQLVKLILDQYKPVDELINLEDDKGNTALHFAATKTPAMVHLLLETGASANVKNSRKLTPLIISVITSRDDNVIIPRMLLKFGANPNDMHDSQTVIHTAIGMGLLQIAGALVKAGAKMDVEDSEGRNVFEKLDRKSTKFLISHVYFPPTYITEKERSACMLCHKKMKFGHRKVNCTHCGRLCCSDCCALNVAMVKFPMGFPGRTRRGAANNDPKKVCKTCYAVFKEREEQPEKPESRFLNRIIGIEWDEVNPNKLQTTRAAGRRGEKH